MVEPRSKVDNEAVVLFASSSVRDSIKASSFKFEGVRAGIRMEIPKFLKSDFQVLQSVSYRLKMTHAGLKRSIKFDDEGLGLMLDVQIPGCECRRIRPEQARAAKRTDPLLRSDPEELSNGMITDTIRSGDSSSISS